ncbi:GlxA family transcriptional regulator [Pelagibius litoralis]|uniref:GlxA family transcriptional regulator n=1 Tax=Pelagibius litoralis TaxID=374515 RepID=UPI001980C573|nr:GlxA family transcriptional regulator [Pelagibius litoralis]
MNSVERFVFLLIEDFSHLAFACAIEPLRIANHVSGKTLYSWLLASENGRQATCSNRSVILVDRGLEPLEPDDHLFVVSGLNVRGSTTRPVIDYLRRESRHGARIGAICSGAYVLAMAGLLDGKPCALHWDYHDAFVEDFPDVTLRRSVFVADKRVMTSSGGPAASDMMLHLIAQEHGADFAIEVANQMVYNAVRSNEDVQRFSLNGRIGVNEKLKLAVRLMEQNLEMPLSTHELADAAGISARQLERLFGKHLHASPKQYYIELRLNRARNLLMQTDASVTEVALSCGFTSHAHFTRRYKQAYGVTPHTVRAPTLLSASPHR